MALTGSLIGFYEFDFKPSAPPSGQVIMYVKTDGNIYLQDDTGTESAFGATTALTALTGDVSATGPGSAAATVNFVGGQAAATIAAATVETEAATSANVVSTIVKRDAGGNFIAGTITATLNGNASTSTSSVSAISFTGPLAGDVTGHQSTTVVALVGGASASNVAAATAEVLAATSINTPGTLVQRDGSGNFIAGTITANLTGNVTGNVSGSAASFTGSLAGDVTGTQGATAISSPTVTGKLLTGLSAGSNTPILASNSILIALENLQAQISASTGAAITALTGDVTAAGPGSAAATVISVGGSSAANIHSAELAANAATALDTPSTIVLRDGSGNFAATNITSNLTGNVLGNLTGNVTGNVSGSAASFTGSLVGDVTGTQGATSVSKIQGTVVAGTTGSGNVVFSASPTLTGTIIAAAANFSGAITASNLTGTNTGDVTETDTNSIAITLTGQNIQANLKISSDAADANNIKATTSIHSGAGAGLHVEFPFANAVNIGTTNMPGSALSVSLSDHVHAISSTIVLGLLLTGYTTGTNTPITAANSILIAFENLQAQISATVGAAITSLTGDVSATGPGAAAATVNSVGGSSAASIHTAQLAVAAATASNTPSTLVLRDGSGNFAAGTITATSLIDSSMTSGSVLFSGAAGLISQDNANFFWNDSTVALGLGTNSPADVLHMVVNTSAANRRVLLEGYGTGNSGYRVRSARGTSGSPTASQSNDVLGVYGALGYGASQFAAANTGATVVRAVENFTNTSNATALSFFTTPTGSVAAAEAMRLNSTGNLLIGSITDGGQMLQVNGTAAINVSSLTALAINSTSFVFDSTNNALGIGTAPLSTVMIDGVNTSGASKLVQMTGYGVGSTTGYRGRFARGTLLSPSAAQTGDILSAVSGRGYGTSQFAAASTGVINVVAGENFTNTSNLTYLQLMATPTGSVTAVEHMRVAATGVTIGPQSSSTDLHTWSGGWIRTNKTITGSYTIDTTTTDDIIYVNFSAAGNITLPTPTSGRTIKIVDISGNAQANPITMVRHGSENIVGIAASKVLYTNFGAWTFSADASGNWWMI